MLRSRKCPGNIPQWTDLKRGKLRSCCLVYFSNLSCQVLLPLYFRLIHCSSRCSHPNASQRLSWSIHDNSGAQVSGRLLSKGLSIKTVVSYICSFTTTEMGEWAYFYSAHAWPYFLHRYQYILSVAMLCCRLYFLPLFLGAATDSVLQNYNSFITIENSAIYEMKNEKTQCLTMFNFMPTVCVIL